MFRVVVDAVDGFEPFIRSVGFTATGRKSVGEEFSNEVVAEVGYLHGGVVVVSDHRKRHVVKGGHKHALGVRCATVRVQWRVHIVFQRLLTDFAVLEVRQQGADDERPDQDQTKDRNASTKARFVLVVMFPV